MAAALDEKSPEPTKPTKSRRKATVVEIIPHPEIAATRGLACAFHQPRRSNEHTSRSNSQETLVLAHVRGAGLHFTKNRRTILAVFLAGTEPVTITDLWLRTKKADPRTSHSTV